jgi:hypothetical protein
MVDEEIRQAFMSAIDTMSVEEQKEEMVHFCWLMADEANTKVEEDFWTELEQLVDEMSI